MPGVDSCWELLHCDEGSRSTASVASTKFASNVASPSIENIIGLCEQTHPLQYLTLLKMATIIYGHFFHHLSTRVV